MSDSLDKLLSFPSTLALDSGSRIELVRFLMISIIMAWVGFAKTSPLLNLVKGPSDNSDFMYLAWLAIGVMFDVSAIVINQRGILARRIVPKFVDDIAVILNIPVIIIFFLLIISFVYDLFASGFWRELAAIAIAVLIQVALVKVIRHLRSRTPLQKTQPAKIRRAIAVTEGLVSTAGASVFGFSAFLLFHLMAESFLPDDSAMLIEEKASHIIERLEHPFGLQHPALQTWLIFALLFVVAVFLRRPRLTSGIGVARRAESIVEMVVLGFLCFSLATAQVEQFGIGAESELLEKATEHLHVAHELRQAAIGLKLDDGEKATLGDSLTLFAERSDSDEAVGLKVISNIERGISDDETAFDENEGTTADPDGDRTGESTRGAADSKVLRIKEKRIREEARAAAATSALQEMLSQITSTVLGSAFRLTAICRPRQIPDVGCAGRVWTDRRSRDCTGNWI